MLARGRRKSLPPSFLLQDANEKEPQMAETTERLKEIEERAKNATEGPWSEDQEDRGKIVSGLMPDPEHVGGTIYDWCIAEVAGPFCVRPTTELFDGTPNIAFIAHAREDVPWLLSLLQASQERERKMRRLLMTARAQAENGLRCSVLTDWYREGTELLKDPRLSTKGDAPTKE
jgi:hypothetical protein